MSAPVFIRPGAAVWARMGAYGWSAAFVSKVCPKNIHITFPERGGRGKGRRKPDELRPRDPALRGRDKPPSHKAQRPPADLTAESSSHLLDNEIEARLSGGGGDWVEE